MSSINIPDELETRKIQYKVSDWVKTMRVQTALVTSLSLWAGYISVADMMPRDAFALGTLGVLFHIFGFTLNEVKDHKYDARIDNGSEHPIAKGKINPETAKHVAWYALFMCLTLSLLFSISYSYNMIATFALAISAIPGYIYNKYSKQHWWANIYMAIWVSTMVLAGSLYAGQPTNITGLIAAAISIQVFVQVMEGDLKDITGNENTFCKRLGVQVHSAYQYVNHNTGLHINPEEIEADDNVVVSYTKRFVGLVYGLKLTELLIFIYISFIIIGVSATEMRLYVSLYFITCIIFITSMSMVLVYVYNRERIKKASSVHELSAIVLIGLTLMPLSIQGGIIVATAPILWYIAVNRLLYSDPLNPNV